MEKRRRYPGYTTQSGARSKLPGAPGELGRAKNPVVNTLEESLHLARILSAAIAKHESKAYRSYRIFSAFASDEPEALAAFFIWSGRGKLLKEFFQK